MEIKNIWLPIIVAVSALFGVLGARFIDGYFNRKSREAELFYKMKLESYSALLNSVNRFLEYPGVNFHDFTIAIYRCRIVASDALDEQLLELGLASAKHSEGDDSSRAKIGNHVFDVSEAMRKELSR